MRSAHFFLFLIFLPSILSAGSFLDYTTDTFHSSTSYSRKLAPQALSGSISDHTRAFLPPDPWKHIQTTSEVAFVYSTL